MNENLLNCRFDLVDCVMHADAIHRGGGQIIPATIRCLKAAMLRANPRVMEPIYLVEISCPKDFMGGVYPLIISKRGEVVFSGGEDVSRDNLKAYLPVLESFDFTEKLRDATKGRANANMIFDHWKKISADPFEKGTDAYERVNNRREEKKLGPIDEHDRLLNKLEDTL